MAATVTVDKAYFETLLRRYALSLSVIFVVPSLGPLLYCHFPVADINLIELNLSVLTETDTACLRDTYGWCSMSRAKISARR